MPHLFFDNSELKRLDNGRIIWLINVKGDGNCGYHAWLSAVVNGENMNHVILKLYREGILTNADSQYVINKTFQSTENHGIKLRHFLLNNILRRANTFKGRYQLSKVDFAKAKKRIQQGNVPTGGTLGLGWMENDELQMLSYIFKINIFVQIDTKKNLNGTKIHDLSLTQVGNHNNAPKIFMYTSGMHFQVLDSKKSKIHNINPYTNIISVNNSNHRTSTKKISKQKYDKITQNNVIWEEVVRRGKNGDDVILFYNKETGNWILPENNLKSKLTSMKSKNDLFGCRSCTFDYNPKKEGNRCPICGTSKNGLPPNITTESDRETSILLDAKNKVIDKNISPEVTNSAKLAIQMVEEFKKKETALSAKKAKKALQSFSVLSKSSTQTKKSKNSADSLNRKKIKKQIENNAKLARQLQREEINSYLASKSLSKSKSSSSSKSKLLSSNSKSSSYTNQTSSLQSNLLKVKNLQIKENEELARKLQNEYNNSALAQALRNLSNYA